MPDACPAERVFLACETQWRHAPSGRYVGLHYRGARAAAKGIGERLKAFFGRLRVMEAAVLEAQRERE